MKIKDGLLCMLSLKDALTGKVVVPDEVTAIAEGVFSNQSIKSVVLPNSITEIPEMVFWFCDRLENIKLPENIKEIPKQTFASCKKLKEVKIPETVEKIGKEAFMWCSALEKIELPKNVKDIEQGAFRDCTKLKSIELPYGIDKIDQSLFERCEMLESVRIPDTVSEIDGSAFFGCDKLTTLEIPFKARIYAGYDLASEYVYMYFNKDGKHITLAKEEQPEFLKSCYCVKDGEILVEDIKTRINTFKALQLKDSGKIKFIPQKYVLQNMPEDEFQNFFTNNNNIRWGKLVKQCGFDKLEGLYKQNTLNDLFKIYYALGGFSENQGQSEKAADFVLSYVVNPLSENFDVRKCANNVHDVFGGIKLTKKFNPKFAEFFMKYYKDNPEFLNTEADEAKFSYISSVHNMFDNILEEYPNKLINTRRDNDRLTPELCIDYVVKTKYVNIEKGNEVLADIASKYGYSQAQFDKMQKIYDKAKQIKDDYVICADKSFEQGCVTFRVLEKLDPFGFEIGHKTNCCQHIGGAGSTCVDDGYTNPNAGFLVFEQSVLDENGNKTGKTRILGQAYVWYDAEQKTVCYDNIEMPESVISEIEKNNSKITADDILDAVKLSANAIVSEMKKRGNEVEKVTVGKGYNDLNKQLKQNFPIDEHPKAKNKQGVYSDASNAQYVVLDLSSHKKEKKETETLAKTR